MNTKRPLQEPGADSRPGRLLQQTDLPKKDRKSVYITLTVAALLLLMSLLSIWRTRAFERRTATAAQNLPPRTHELRYRMPGVDQVFLVWGIDGWNPVPESLRPASTEIKDGVMHTPMARDGDTFTAKIQAPANTIVAYGFLIVTSQTDESIPAIWDGDSDYQLASAFNRTIYIEPTMTPESR